MKMKLTLAVLTACTLGALSTAEARTVCPYTDNFYISAPVPLHVLSYATDGNVNFNLMDANYFQLSCLNVPSSADGNAYIQIGLNNDTKCSLTIHDGPFNMNPTVSYVYCGGPGAKIYFMGMDHVVGSYNYTLKFSL